MVLTYYQYTSHSFEHVSSYKTLENEWNYGDSVSKVNNHSKMAWWKPYFTNEIIISFFDLIKNPKGELNTIKIRNRLPSILGLNSVTLSIAQLW